MYCKDGIAVSPPISQHFKRKKLYKKRIYYLLTTFVLLVFLLQALRGAYLNITKYFILQKQLSKLENINNIAKNKNSELKKLFKVYTSAKGIEALARDNLKLVGNNEVLLVIKRPLIQNTKKINPCYKDLSTYHN